MSAAGEITAVAFSQDGKRLASAGQDHVIHLWDVGTRAEVALLRGHREVVRDVAFSPDGRWLASGSDSGEDGIRIWDVAKQVQVRVLEGHTFGVYSLAFRDDGRLLASSGADGFVKVGGLAPHRRRSAVDGPTGRG